MEKNTSNKPALRHGEPWTDRENNALNEAFQKGASIQDLMEVHSRSRNSIRSRLRKNGLIEDARLETKKPVENTKTNKVTPPEVAQIERFVPVPDYEIGPKSWVAQGSNFEKLDPQSLHDSGFISVRVKNVLIEKGIQDIRDTFDLSVSQLKRMPNFGRKSYEELIEFRDQYFTKIVSANATKQIQISNIKARVEDAETSLHIIARDAAPIRNELGGDINLGQLNKRIRKLRHDLSTIERLVHKHEYGFDTLETNQRIWTANTETAQLLISHLNAIISAAASDERKGFILKARIGLADGYLPQTLEQIGIMYDVTRERIRQLQKKTNSRVACYICDANSNDSSQFAEICKSLFHDMGTHPENKIIEFVQQHYGNMVSQVDMAAYFYVGAGLSRNFHKTRKSFDGKFMEYRRKTYKQKKQNYFEDKALEKWANIFQYCLYPSQSRIFDKVVTGFDQSLRIPNPESTGILGTFFSEKCQRQIKYESGEEFNIYQILENSPKIKWYREQPVIIPYTHLEREHNYYPDIVVLTEEGHGVVMEVKTPWGSSKNAWQQRGSGMVHWQVLSKALAAKDFLHQQGIGYLMVDSRGQSLQSLSQHEYNPQTGSHILDAIHQNGGIDFKQFKAIIGSQDFSDKDLYSLIIRNDLAFQLAPFRLSRLPTGQSFAPLL